ncbi:MAG: hypothetical protein WAO20_16310 [Acidobacteriota bacterium]
MKRLNGIGFFVLSVAILLLAFQPVFANLQLVYKTRLSNPGVRGVSGSAVLETNLLGGWTAMVASHGVDYSVSEVWLSTGPYAANCTDCLPLCGVPGGSEETCEFNSDGDLVLQTNLTSGLLATWNWRGSDFRYAINNHLMVVTVIYGGGSLSGTLDQIFP